MKLAIVTTHPVQYNAPWFRLLAREGKISVKVFYTWEQSGNGPKYDAGFGRVVEWDIPLLEGYDYTFTKNVADDPGLHHFRGIVNPDLIKEIELWKADALLVFGWNYHSHLKSIRFFHKKIPILFRGDSTLLNEKPGVRRLARRIFLTWVFSHIDVALYTGVNNRSYYLKHGLKETQLMFAPHAIDNERFGNPAEQYAESAKKWRQELGIKETDLVILFAGKLEKVKNSGLLLQMAAGIPDPSLRIVFVGNGHLEAALKKEAEGDNRIIFLDFQNQNLMPVVYRLGDVFILPSESETWGLAVNEAMACGLPVLVSNKCGCAPDLIQEGENGYIFDYQNVDDLISKVKQLINNKRSELAQMGSRSREIISGYSMDAIVMAVQQTVYGKG